MFLSAMYSYFTSAHPTTSTHPHAAVRVLPKSLYGKNVPAKSVPHSFFSHFYGSSWHADDAGFIWLPRHVGSILALHRRNCRNPGDGAVGSRTKWEGIQGISIAWNPAYQRDNLWIWLHHSNGSIHILEPDVSRFRGSRQPANTSGHCLGIQESRKHYPHHTSNLVLSDRKVENRLTVFRSSTIPTWIWIWIASAQSRKDC